MKKAENIIKEFERQFKNWTFIQGKNEVQFTGTKELMKAWLENAVSRQDENLCYRITKLFKKYIAKRPNGNCQILFALTELDDFVDEILIEIGGEKAE